VELRYSRLVSNGNRNENSVAAHKEHENE
jgi:hypothetical protein